MKLEHDVIIVGSGPAGVSAAFPLAKSGLKVLMIEGGSSLARTYINDDFIRLRAVDSNQWKWMLGENFHALRMEEAVSPKLRVPDLSYVFNNFSTYNRIRSSDFVSIGALSAGGLSNAWGAGVARFSKEELKHLPYPANKLDSHYKSIESRIGISGKSGDDLSSYFSVDESAHKALPLDDNNSDLFSRYQKNRNKFVKYDFKLGRSRIAVLSADQGTRKACSLSGNCLWGCANKSIYSAAEDILALKQYGNFEFLSNYLVYDISNDNGNWTVIAEHTITKESRRFVGRKLVLAAGTLATTRLALKVLNLNKSVRILSSPTAAFIVWNYRRFGAARRSGFGLGQLSYVIDVSKKIRAFGSTFSTNSIPISEFAKHVPLKRTLSIDVLGVLLSSCVVGNVFLPGHLTSATARLDADKCLDITGHYADTVAEIMNSVSVKLNGAFFNMGALMLPGSFKIGLPGSDIHYAGSLPMSERPSVGETSAVGELSGAHGLYIVDGACLPILPEKSHTLTIMANAERIGSYIANMLK